MIGIYLMVEVWVKGSYVVIDVMMFFLFDGRDLKCGMKIILNFCFFLLICYGFYKGYVKNDFIIVKNIKYVDFIIFYVLELLMLKFMIYIN